MSEDREKRKKRLEENKKHEAERIKPKLDPYRRSKVRDNDRHGRYEDDD